MRDRAGVSSTVQSLRSQNGSVGGWETGGGRERGLGRRTASRDRTRLDGQGVQCAVRAGRVQSAVRWAREWVVKQTDAAREAGPESVGGSTNRSAIGRR